MTDYREISQQYAQGTIKACILINAGAAVALLSQANELLKQQELKIAIVYAMLWWMMGVVAGVLTWLAAFFSTRYVDKSERETGKEVRNLRRSNVWMGLAIVLVLASLTFFVAGCLTLACNIR